MKRRFTGQAQQDEIRRYLSLETGGILRWNVLKGELTRTEKRHNTLYSGKVAGSVCKTLGYRLVMLKKVMYKAHVIVFFLHHGRWPVGIVDHENGIRDDNRPENLRETDASGNSCNAKLSSRNSSGVKGVSWNAAKGKWKVRVTKRGECHFGGWFSDFDTAAGVAADIRRKLHGEFAK